jgi:phospholipid N-methyltransferase
MQRAETGHAQSAVSRPMAFFRGFLRHPRYVGSVVPSSVFLARRLAGAVRGARTVVELGPGTGAVTQAMLRVLPARSRLLAIELDEDFATMLENVADERLIVHRGNATQLSQAVARHALHNVDAVVSGIPFSTIGTQRGLQVLEQAWASLQPGGVFIAYQIRGDVARLAGGVMGAPRTAIELRNVPPLRIYSWRKPLSGGDASTT